MMTIHLYISNKYLLFICFLFPCFSFFSFLSFSFFSFFPFFALPFPFLFPSSLSLFLSPFSTNSHIFPPFIFFKKNPKLNPWPPFTTKTLILFLRCSHCYPPLSVFPLLLPTLLLWIDLKHKEGGDLINFLPNPNQGTNH